jgi:hypothetical protein
MPDKMTARFWVVLLALMAPLSRLVAADIPVFVPPNASSVERLAAADLSEFLGRLYPRERFVATTTFPEFGSGIVVGCSATSEVVHGLIHSPPSAPESFRIAVWRNPGRELGVIAGADPHGVAYGVYALLEKLGCGFYLSCDALPPAKEAAFSFDAWQLSDQPVVRDRLVFDWHNFLSGCSTWNLPQWKSWILQAQKMRYNAVMVHAYGNNPMVSFQFNGRDKPVGYLSTTVKGRDWSTMHVNDVRQLWGGQVFSEPVFGANAAQVPDERRAASAQGLMRQVFAYAQERGMDIYFADDVDTISANPQELIQTLPLEARFATGGGKVWLANPDTPEGFQYYRAQVEALMTTYPQLTCLVVWFRTGGTPWMDLTTAEMPARWQQEYQSELARTPEAAKLWHAPNRFAISKIVSAWERALRETGHAHVQVAAGTWDFKFLPAADRFLPRHVKLIGLDYNVLHDHPQLGDAESRRVLREVGAHRPVLPVIWAHHDDGNYIGRPYTPFAEFASKLADANACGFGIIHWTTRPLDLFFASHARQVWAGSVNEPLHATCLDMAGKSFGASARENVADYLEHWVTGAPKFARETGNLFIDRPLTNVEQVVKGCRERLELLGKVERSQLTPEQRDRLDYFRGLEQFIADIYQTHSAFQHSAALLKSGDLAGARAAMAACRPEPVVEEFARFSSLGGITRGEQGLVVSMNSRWLPHYLRQRQALGLETVRYNFAPTSHDKLAQAPGPYTWYFDQHHRIWQTLGTEETGASLFALPAAAKVTLSVGLSDVDETLCRAGIESDKPFEFALHPVMGKAALPAGKYRLRLLLLDAVSQGPGQNVFTVAIRRAGGASTSSAGQGAPASWEVRDEVDIWKATGQANQVLERNYPVTLGATGEIGMKLTPSRGKARLSAVILEPER